MSLIPHTHCWVQMTWLLHMGACFFAGDATSSKMSAQGALVSGLREAQRVLKLMS